MWLQEQVRGALGQDLVGLYLAGSFALRAGDVHADVDFLVVTRGRLTPDQEQLVRGIHRQLPDRREHWAQVLEGSYASIDALRRPADRAQPWLYVDNGHREMDLSAHDNTWVFRWVLKHAALAVSGPPAASLIPEVPRQLLRDEAAALAVRRQDGALADPEYLENAWGQPHEVLTNCRMLYTATTGTVAGKIESARWCLSIVPIEWHDLIEAAIRDRPDPWTRIHQSGDPRRAAATRSFITQMTRLVVAAAAAPAAMPGG